jgi:CzcA family heavy metal efflux pump
VLQHLILFSLRFRGPVLALAAVVVAYGVYLASHARLDVFPEFAPPQVVIQTEAPGLSSDQVEELVTRPVENGVNGVGNLESLRSESIQGLSKVTAVFREGTNVMTARQMVSERLVQAAGQLPVGVKSPTLEPLTSSTSLILALGFTSTKRSPMELRTFVDWTVRPRLQGVSGVAKTVEFGGEVRELQIQVLPERLVAYDLPLSEVVQAARESTGVLGAGFVETATQRISIRMEGQSLTAEELAQAVVAHREGHSVRLGDVARVVEGPEPKVGDALINGTPGVLLQVWAQYGTNTLEVTQAVEEAISELRPALASAEVTLADPPLFRPASFISQSIRNINISLLTGGGLVAIVLMLFLFNWRTAVISLSAIPLSLLVAVIVLDRFGATLNTLTLGGFAIAIGEVVDDAIIDVENILRRLRENRASSTPKSAFRVVLDASLEVRSAVVYATFVVALVFVPVLTMSGIQGKLFSPLGVAYILATLASLLVALTVTPALSLLLLARAEPRPEPRFLGALKRAHLACLRMLADHPRWTMAFPLLLMAWAVPMILSFGGELIPEFQEGNYIIQVSAIPGTSAPEAMRIGKQVSDVLLANEHVATVGLEVGRAELGEDTVGTDYSEFVVTTKEVEGEEAAALQKTLQEDLNRQFPGVKFAVKTFLSERIEETISGTKAPFVVRVFGNDLSVVESKATEVEEVLSKVRGAAGVQYLRPDEPQLRVTLRRDRLRELGFRPVEVMEAVQTYYEGNAAAQTYDQNRLFDVVVLLDPARRRDPEALSRLLVRSHQGTQVPLGELAEIHQSTARHVVLHSGTRRYQEVSCQVSGIDQATFVREAQKAILEKVRFSNGTYPRFEGEAVEQSSARQEILLHSILAGAAILLLLSVVFRRARNLLLVLVNIPFALVGGIFAVYFFAEAEGPMVSVGSLVGFVTLFGITTRNSIMMISHFEHLVRSEGRTWNLDTALRGASERLVPILMTALVTGLGLLPVALGGDEAGREVEGPMALVILGGLATSTLLNLLVLPTLALRFGAFGPGSQDPEVEG